MRQQAEQETKIQQRILNPTVTVSFDTSDKNQPTIKAPTSYQYVNEMAYDNLALLMAGTSSGENHALSRRIQNALIYRTLFEQFILELRIGDDAFLDQ